MSIILSTAALWSKTLEPVLCGLRLDRPYWYRGNLFSFLFHSPVAHAECIMDDLMIRQSVTDGMRLQREGKTGSEKILHPVSHAACRDIRP